MRGRSCPRTDRAGAVLISTLTTLFLTGIEQDPDVPAEVTSTNPVALADGIRFASDAQLKTTLDDAGVSATTTDAIVEENAFARLVGLPTSLAVLAFIALIALFFTRKIPTGQHASIAAA
jgi:hypothetical protein